MILYVIGETEDEVLEWQIWMWYLFNQRMEYAGQDRRTCSIRNWVCRREAVHIFSIYTVRVIQYLLTAKDSFSRYCRTYPIPNKEARTLAKVFMDQHFNVFQFHLDNGKEFANNLWRELFSKFKIQHTTTPPYNLSSNPVECFHRTIIAIKMWFAKILRI